ncbi:hypothetical protein [Roseateles albus]|uniref:Uncharacterized protein n=1 Tax=Roseateles albus TaxID=2987525 RepID=A0ABT5KEJ3_9BURK|nr:hypothetical protein [Roseateles albus]MDC8772328.1 hypothetical protein [Roseateles albus]
MTSLQALACASAGNSPFSIHTPGPWSTERGQIYAGSVCLAEAFSGAANSQAEALANARLMAAAPELLAALLALVDVMIEGDTGDTDSSIALFEAVAVITPLAGEVAA